MGKSEPILAPEWLKGVKGRAASNANADDHGSGYPLRNRLSLLEEPRNRRDDTGRVKPLNYDNFGRRWNRISDVDVRDGTLLRDVGSRGGLRDSGFGIWGDVNSPWNSRSAESRRGDLWSKSLNDDLDDFVHPRGSLFKREFPSLGAEERQKPLSRVHIAPISSGLNMAETVAKSPLRARTAPQSLNSPVKPKSKGARAGQKPSSQLLIVNNALRAVTARQDGSKESQVGNLQVLKRDKNGTISCSAVKDVSDSDVSFKSHANQNLRSERKDTDTNSMSSLKWNPISFGENRSLSQAKGRKDFFNSIKKKAHVKPSTGSLPDSVGCGVGALEKSLLLNEQKSGNLVADANGSVAVGKVRNDGALSEDVQNEDFQSEAHVDDKENSSHPSGISLGNYDPVFNVNEEVAFLRSLGWDEHANVEAIKDEEIAAFKKQYGKTLRLLSNFSLLN